MIENPERLAVLGRIDLDSTELRQRLDKITERTAQRLDRPIGLVSMVFDTAQEFVGSHGLAGWLADVGGTPIEWSFCASAVASGGQYVVPDAATDARQSDNPLVTADGIRSYAGAPIVVDGEVLGAHCVMGYDPHAFTPDDLAELERGAEEISAILREYPVAV
jgi:GAF domain-containing protein